MTVNCDGKILGTPFKWDNGFFGRVVRVVDDSPEQMAWHRKMERALPVRPEGWTRYLCATDSSIITQATT